MIRITVAAMLSHLRSFLAVLEEGSLHRAAGRLHISQSALSRQMQALEHELGGPLLERSSTGVTPTSGGRALAARMGPVVAAYEANLLAVRRIMRGTAGELRVGYLASAFEEYLEPALQKLRRLHPAVKVKLLDLFPGEQITELRHGNIDLAITDGHGTHLGRDFQTRKFAVVTCFVSLPDHHPLASRKQVRLAELKDEIFIVGSDAEVPGSRRRLMGFCRKCGNFSPKIVEVPGGLSEAFSTVANDGAVAVLPGFLRHHRRPGMVMVPVSDPQATWDLVAVSQAHPPEGPLRSLLEALAAGA